MLTRRAVCVGLGALALAPGTFAAEPPIAPPIAPPPITPPPIAPPPIAGLRLRAAWKAAPALPGGRPHVPTRFALHHTAGKLVGSSSAPSTLRGIQAYHQRDKGWVDLAYHVFVDADGVAWEGRDPAIAGDTATDYDPAGWLLVCALGNFEEVEPPAAQREGLARVLAALHHARGLPLDTLTPHRALASTLCPGAHLQAHVEGIRARAAEIAAAPR